MTYVSPVRSWLITGCLLILPFCGTAQNLYNGTNGLPSTQGWIYAASGGTQTSNNNAVVLDTSAGNVFQAGYTRTTSPLNRTNGFTLLFTSQLISEGHANNNRAGFSVIMLSDDKHGLELAFWTNTIFAQTDSPLFNHGEDTNFVTTNFVDYALTFHPTNYTLAANGTTILSGPIRDYTAFSGFPNPYSTPNLLFFGDDTTSAAGIVVLKKIILVTAPQLAAFADQRVIWTGVSNLTYTVLSSSNLTAWTGEASVTSATSQFTFTNTSSTSPRFFRVTYP